MKRWISIAIAGLVFGAAATHAAQVGLIKIDGAIGPATANYISRAIDLAASQNDECLVIELNTPGGLANSMDDIVQDFYASRVPVVVYVSPEGAMAGSAGVYITLAADVAAMAPHTTIGAAHPVELGNEGETTNSIMMQKIGNAYTKVMQTIAEKRHRSVEWAKSAVLDSASITAEEALKTKVIDLISDDMPDLLKQLNGREINGKTLNTAGADVAEIPMTRLNIFPNCSAAGGHVHFDADGDLRHHRRIEHPGAILPGIVGAIALILVLYMSAILPVNVTGLVLIGLAIALFITRRILRRRTAS
jgi:membrane-bound serine protease (ClpP class)